MKKIKNNIVNFAKIGSKSLFLCLKLISSGALISFICSLIGFYLLSNNKGAGFHGADCGGIGAMLGIIPLLKEELFSAILLYSPFLCIPIYFAVANKIALFNALYLTWEINSTEFVLPTISGYMNNIYDKHADSIKERIDRTELLQKLIVFCRRDSSLYKLQRKILIYGLKKIHLDDIDFNKDNFNLPDEIAQKVIQTISKITKPSLKFIWSIIFAQAVLVILALIFDHK